MNDLGPIIFPGLGGLKLNPPNSFAIGNFQIYFYGVIIALGLVLAVTYGLKRSKQFGLKADDILDGVLFIVPFAVICARLYYVFSEWEQYKTFVDVINIRKGGLAIYGGVIGAAIGVIVFAKVKKVSLPAVLDLVALGFLIGQSIGRWGNFMNREAFGSYSDGLFAMQIWESNLGYGTSEAFTKLREMAVQIDGASFISVHPTFLYESIWCFGLFWLLSWIDKYHRKFSGQIICLYGILYSVERFFVEGLRTDSLMIGPLRQAQVISLTIIAGCAVLYYILNRKHNHEKETL